MNFEVTCELLAQAEAYWDEEGLPLLREHYPGDQALILGWSIGQDLPVLLAWQPGPDEDYGDAAREAANILPSDLPSRFICSGTEVARLSNGFYDGSGDWYTEVTLQKEWHASLLQAWLDNQGHPICIRPSVSMETDKVISDHAERAAYSFDHTIRNAAFKAMALRYEVRQYIEAFLAKNGQLPMGSHTVPSGTVVTFHGPGE